MVQQTKQCAGCGAQMGARGRVCPRCGRGSLFGELLWIVVLGVLLLAIGVMSGVVHLDRIPGLARMRAGDRDTAARPVLSAPPGPATTRRPVGHSTKVEARTHPKPSVSYAPCSGTDTESRHTEVSESFRGGPHAAVASSCGQVVDSNVRGQMPSTVRP